MRAETWLCRGGSAAAGGRVLYVAFVAARLTAAASQDLPCTPTRICSTITPHRQRHFSEFRQNERRLAASRK